MNAVFLFKLAMVYRNQGSIYTRDKGIRYTNQLLHIYRYNISMVYMKHHEASEHSEPFHMIWAAFAAGNGQRNTGRRTVRFIDVPSLSFWAEPVTQRVYI